MIMPGAEVVIDVQDLHPGAHLNMLGADARGKAEATVEAVVARAPSATSGSRPRMAAS